MNIFNSLGRKKEKFIPLEPGKVGIYVCGPTVYDNAHLGHGRSAVAFDVIRRYFIYCGYEVKYVSNYTDIDDKMINRAAEEGISVEALAAKVIPEYAADYGALGVITPDVQPLATEYVDEMIEMIASLEENGFTYILDDGVYYDVTKFADYGKLSGNTLDQLQSGARMEVKDSKRNPQDFVLWKFKKEGEPFWSAPWGDGRPGWHIECSAMAWKCLGQRFDIHGGGLDLTFPHHECEIAQTEGCFGAESFARVWMHNGFINIDDEKMSKSLNNFFTLKDIFEKYDPTVVRFMFLQTHYRNPVNFSHVLLDQAKSALERLDGFVRKVSALAGPGEIELSELLDAAEKSFQEAMDEDFDTSGALGAVFELVRQVNILIAEGHLGSGDAQAVLVLLQKFNQVLAILDFEKGTNEVNKEALALIEERKLAREAKDFARSDQLRDQLAAMGVLVEDTAEGMLYRNL